MNIRYRPRMKLGKRDKFWLTITIVVIVILFVVRMASRKGFAGPGEPVWKSAVIGTEFNHDTTIGRVVRASSPGFSH